MSNQSRVAVIMGICSKPLQIVRRQRPGRARGARSVAEQLGQLAGLHRTFVGSVERGESNISIYNIGRLADALGVEPMELFKLDRT
jgi:transcriptional regulator with XRE-family HTH domain